MTSEQTRIIAERSKAIYNERLAAILEPNEAGRFVAIEPNSEEYFVADSFAGAVESSQHAHPDQICFVIKIGSEAALHLGGASKA